MMKRFAIFLICLLIAGCSFSQEPAPTSVDIPTPVPMNITIYHGNENADGFESEIYEVFYFNSTTLIEKLIEAEVLTQEVELLSEEYDGSCLHLDFNNAFRDLLCSMGTAGEYIIIGSLVNTFLENYQDTVTSIFITVNGEIIESGHVIYDFELIRYES